MNEAGSRKITDLSPHGIVYINKENRLEYVNPAFIEMTGFIFDELNGIDLEALSGLILDLCDVESRRLFDINSNERDIHLLWLIPARKHIHFSSRAVEDEAGKPLGRVLYFHDIEHQREQLKLDKSDFLSLAAHKLRTPLVGILGFSELLLKRDFAPNQQKEAISTIFRQATNFKQLLDDYLDVEKLNVRKGDDFNFQETTLEQLFTTVLQEAEKKSGAVTIHSEPPGYWPSVLCDTDKIKQAYFNLVDNAIKYSRADGEITCTTASNTGEGINEFGLVVIDRGIGMSPEELERAGEHFYRANNSSETAGSGLGIALVKAIMHLHHGRLSLDSSKGRGTTATLWLPVIEA